MRTPFLVGIGLAVALPFVLAAEPPGTVTVVADGAGTTPDEATKDAVRNAVRQVVGVLIDAETLVKNDDLISDKVIAFSNGFVKSFETIHEKKDGGLVRVRVRALVEKGQVATRLKEAKVVTSDVDGASLAAEKMTKEEARKNAKELVKKQIVGFEKLLRAEVVGRPALDKEGTLVAQVAVSVDETKYYEKIKHFETVLDKVATKKDSLLLAGTPFAGFRDFPAPVRSFPQTYFAGHFYRPDDALLGKLGDVSTVWVMSFADAKRSKMRWNGYKIDAALGDALSVVAGEYIAQVVLADAAGKPVGVEEIPICGPWRGDRPERSANRVHRTDSRCDAWMLVGGWQGTVEHDARFPTLLAVSPFAVFQQDARPYQTDTIPLVAKYKLTDAELARVKSATGRVVVKPYKDD